PVGGMSDRHHPDGFRVPPLPGGPTAAWPSVIYTPRGYPRVQSTAVSLLIPHGGMQWSRVSRFDQPSRLRRTSRTQVTPNAEEQLGGNGHRPQNPKEPDRLYNNRGCSACGWVDFT